MSNSFPFVPNYMMCMRLQTTLISILYHACYCNKAEISASNISGSTTCTTWSTTSTKGTPCDADHSTCSLQGTTEACLADWATQSYGQKLSDEQAWHSHMPSSIGKAHKLSPVWLLCHAGEQPLADQTCQYLPTSSTMTQWQTRQSNVKSDLKGSLRE